MNINTLIEELEYLRDQHEDEEIDVVFAYDYGDHCHSEAAQSIDIVEDGFVERSSYLRMDKVVSESHLDDEDVDESRRKVIILK